MKKTIQFFITIIILLFAVQSNSYGQIPKGYKEAKYDTSKIHIDGYKYKYLVPSDAKTYPATINYAKKVSGTDGHKHRGVVATGKLDGKIKGIYKPFKPTFTDKVLNLFISSTVDSYAGCNVLVNLLITALIAVAILLLYFYNRKIFTVKIWKRIFVGLIILVGINASGTFDWHPHVYNVRAYGAIGNGIHNDGPGIQAAINAADAGGGGKVYFPDGIYADADTIRADCNCQIFIPQHAVATDATRNEIIIEGESINPEPNGAGSSGGANVPSPTSGAIIYSKLAAFKAAGNAIFGSKTTGGFNIEGLQVKNIGLEIRNNPSGHGPVIGGIQWRYGCNLKFDNVKVFIDTSGYNSTAASYPISGIETPDDGSGENYSITNCSVWGLRHGYRTGEHVVFDNDNAVICYKGFDFKAGTHNTTGTRCGAYECAYDIYAEGAVTLSSFHLDAEWQQVSMWFDDVTTVKDSANLLTGQLYYTIIQAFVGKNNAKFSVSGAANSNFHYSSDDAGTAVASTGNIGSTVGSGTAGSILYLGASNVLAQDNSNFFYDYTNHRVGLGTTTPASMLELKATVPSLTINAGTSGNGAINFQKSGILKNQIGQDLSSNGTANFYMSDAATVFLFHDPTGNTNLGGTASATGTSAIHIDPSNNITANLGNFTTSSLFATTSLAGQTTSGGALNLTSTTNATKGLINFGTASAYNEATDKWGLGTTTTTAGKVTISSTGGTTNGLTITATSASSYSDIDFITNNGLVGQFLMSGSGFSSGILGGNEMMLLHEFTSGKLTIGTLSNLPTRIVTNNAERVVVSGAGAVRFNTYGAGSISADASGNLTSSSDVRLKTNIQPFTTGLKELMNLNPITYRWNKLSGNEMDSTYAGFSAQNVKANIPHGTGTDSRGYLSLQDRAIMATLVNAVKEQQIEIQHLKVGSNESTIYWFIGGVIAGTIAALFITYIISLFIRKNHRK